MNNPTQDEEMDEILNTFGAGVLINNNADLIYGYGDCFDEAKAALHRLMLKERLKQTRRILQHEVDVWKVSRNRSYLESEIKELKAGIAELSSQIEGSKSDE